ncbi:MAG: hypothetical protein ACYC9O_06435 [Candidatus Latescibacterota bacterium]
MKKHALIFCILLLLYPAFSHAFDAGLFRTLPADTPRLGVLRAVNSSFYSRIQPNAVLIRDYSVEHARVLTSITDLELGLPGNLALTVSLPYSADLFSQHDKKGYKGGAGDVSAGFRFSMAGSEGTGDRFGFGARFLIPEKIGYGREPLGFRTFSTGESGYALESSARIQGRLADWHATAALYRFPGAPELPGADPAEIMYDTGFGYRAIGKSDPTGFAPTLFLDQLHLSAGGALPLRHGIMGILEFHAASFLESPKREAILRLTPGIRLGSPEGMNAAFGLDIGLSGPVPRTSFVFKLAIPSFSPREIGRGFGLSGRASVEQQMRSRNALVAVKDFSGSGKTLFDDRGLRSAFQNALGALEMVKVVPGEQVDRAFRQEALVPVKDSPRNLGVRIGANFLIDAEILSYRSIRASRFSIPWLVRFPTTSFVLTARAKVTNLAGGETHDLGIISATLVKERGVLFFPTGPSSDLRYFSEPETRILERELANRWVDAFNTRIFERLDLFEWEPKRTDRRQAGSGG